MLFLKVIECIEEEMEFELNFKWRRRKGEYILDKKSALK